MTSPAGKTHELAGRVALTTTRLARLLRQQDEGDMSLTQRSALATIERHGPMTLSALGQVEHIAAPTVTKVVGHLDERGYIERIPDTIDRRVCRVAITKAGAARLAADRRRRTAWLADRLRRLDDDERSRLTETIAVLEAMIEGAATGSRGART